MASVLKRIRFILVVFVLLSIAPWLTSYVYGSSDGVSVEELVKIEAATPSMKPSATFYGKAIGGVTPGDLFYIDAIDSPHDMTVSLYLTNAHELTPYLRYLILKVGIYFEGNDGQWRKASFLNSNTVPDTFITLRNSPVKLVLHGYKRYKVTIDSGCFYCLSANTNGGNLLPHFYLTAEPA